MEPSALEARLLFRSNTIQRLASPRYTDLCPTPSDFTVGTTLNAKAAAYRQQVMRYDYMKHRGRDFDDPVAGWNRLLGYKPAIRPFRMRVQRGTGRLPKMIPVYGIAPIVQVPAVVARLAELTAKDYPTLQPHYFDSFVRGNNPREDVVGWLDILNGFCWFVDEEMFRGTLRMLGLATLWNNTYDKTPWEATAVIPSTKQQHEKTNTTNAVPLIDPVLGDLHCPTPERLLHATAPDTSPGSGEPSAHLRT